jgi:hypothetical protein
MVGSGDGEGKFFIGVVYLAPATVPGAKEVNLELLEELSQDIFQLRNHGKICLVGDFNCRIGEMESRIESELDEEERESNFKRSSEDKKVDQEGEKNDKIY